MKKLLLVLLGYLSFIPSAFAATSVPFTIAMSEGVNVTGTPRIAVDVGGVTRYAEYASGTGTSALTFTYSAQAGDVDLDGVTLSSPIDLNGGTITDLNGNPQTNLAFTVPDTSGVRIDYPSLSMNFIADADGRYALNGTIYNDLPALITATGGSYTRNSIGTYFDSTGTLQTASANQPRFDHDPVTHAPKGLLIEDQKTNQLTRSESIEYPIWQKSNISVTTNALTAPDGTLTAEKVNNNIANSSFFLLQDTSITSGLTYTQSLYAKAGEISYIQIGASTGFDNLNTWVNFDLNTGSIGNHGLNGTYTISAAGNGWYRITLTATATSSSGAGRFYFSPMSTDINSRNPSYNNPSVAGLYLWGAQLEVGSYSTSYIPTNALAVTRNNDNLTIPTNFWYNQSAGTFYNDISWETITDIYYPMFFRVDDTTNDNRWNTFYIQNNSNLGVDGFTGGVSQGFWFGPAALSGSAKIAAAQSLNNANAALNGSIGALDTSWTPPSVTQLQLYGKDANKYFKSLKYYPRRVSDTQLQLLTQ